MDTAGRSRRRRRRGVRRLAPAAPPLAQAPGVAECLGLAGLVSFARAEPGEEGFERVIAAAREAIPAARAP
ncbi:MAG: hypothetical protein EB833_02930 [Thaumarchaeota archaeon S13]|nr:MAG: hypothetical protein EB833_02930 [Thaumarchaeota archaeon S13]